jgi:phospholipase C
MSRSAWLSISILLLSAVSFLLSLSGCGGGASSGPPPAKASYTLGAAGLSPASVTAGGTATSTITVTPVNGYTGSVSLSCSSITGATPPPICSFSASPVVISGTAAATSTLTLSTSIGTPDISVTITVTGSDANDLAPGNGPQTLTLTMASVIQHVVIIFQENRTPDNLFQGLCLPPNGNPSNCNSTNPTASQYDIASSGTDSTEATITLGPIDLGTTATNGNPDNYDLSHAHSAFVDMCDLNPATGKCAMDGANLIPNSCDSSTGHCPPPPNPQFMYVYPNDVQPYLTMAKQYAFADHMFQTNEGPSFPAHQFIISGTSAPTATSPLFAAENPGGVAGAAGCIAPAGAKVAVIDAAGSETSNPPIYPCFEHPTLTDSLDNANISWRYYAPLAGSIWTAPDAIEHMCVPSAPTGGECTGSDWTGMSPKVVLNQTQSNAQILTDIASTQLQQVSWVIPTGQDSDHARINNGCGPSWVTSIVNAIGDSPYWSNTVVILTWDDWGGWYDHVPPAVIVNNSSWGSGYVYGFRVPMVVMSPYAKPAYISHITHDFGSILKFIESNFNLPSLGYADAPADDLSDIFNFAQTPIGFQTIQQPPPPLDAATCASDSGPASDPDDD